MDTPITLLISGAPGTGKSTLRSHAPYFFREHWGETAALSLDLFYQMFDPGWRGENRAWWAFATANCLAVAASMFQQGVQVVIIEGNGLYTAKAVDHMLATLLPISAVYHFTLDAQLPVVTARVRQRGDGATHPEAWLAAWLEHIRSHYAGWTQLIDTSTLTPAQVLEQIAHHLALEHGRLTALLPRDTDAPQGQASA